MGYPTNKNRLSGKKNRKSNIGARYLPSSSNEGVSSRRSIVVITVTVIIVMNIGDERKRKARICFGISFSPKNHHLNRNYYRERSLFFSLPHADNYQRQFMSTRRRQVRPY